jgi:hypothetical protein
MRSQTTGGPVRATTAAALLVACTSADSDERPPIPGSALQTGSHGCEASPVVAGLLPALLPPTVLIRAVTESHSFGSIGDGRGRRPNRRTSKRREATRRSGSTGQGDWLTTPLRTMQLNADFDRPSRARPAAVPQIAVGDGHLGSATVKRCWPPVACFPRSTRIRPAPLACPGQDSNLRPTAQETGPARPVHAASRTVTTGSTVSAEGCRGPHLVSSVDSPAGPGPGCRSPWQRIVSRLRCCLRRLGIEPAADRIERHVRPPVHACHLHPAPPIPARLTEPPRVVPAHIRSQQRPVPPPPRTTPPLLPTKTHTTQTYVRPLRDVRQRHLPAIAGLSETFNDYDIASMVDPAGASDTPAGIALTQPGHFSVTRERGGVQEAGALSPELRGRDETR